MIPKISVAITLVVAFILALSFESRGGEPAVKRSYVERIQTTAETMEIFPVDLIARDGPLSFFKKDSPYPQISVRTELNREAFARFYDFCQLAFDATPEDINECVKYLPQASAKEKSLIITVFYVYIYPWNKQKRVTNMREVMNAIRTRSWLSLQYPCDAFDLTIRKRRQFPPTDSEQLLRIISQYLDNEEIAFQGVVIDSKIPDPLNVERDRKEVLEFIRSSNIGDGDQAVSSLIRLTSRKETMEKIRLEHPDSSTKIMSDILYFSYWQDMFNPTAGILPREGNASEKPKALGQIAQQLLESWASTPTDDARN